MTAVASGNSTRLILKNERATAIEFVRCTLVVAAGPDAGREHVMETARLTIGTSLDCGLALKDPSVSRLHAEIAVDERGFLVKDLGSKNGTQIGNVLVKEAYVEPGGTLTLGTTRLELRASDRRVEVRLSDDDRFGETLGRSLRMREIFYMLERVAKKDVTILITGETGTGKDVLARSIHAKSPRKDAPFVTVDCASLPAELVESTLFGHAKGAFTGADKDRAGAVEQAHAGTVFFDEIGELPLDQQPKLLRVLEAREIRRVGESKPRKVDVRVIAATNRLLADEVAAGRFREDLLYRLRVLDVRLPPLRERAGDIAFLAEHFLAKLGARSGKPAPALSAHARFVLDGHTWPGNVRELRNVLERAAAMTEGTIDAADVAAGSLRDDPAAAPARGAAVDARIPFDEATDRFERDYLLDLLRIHKLNVTDAAEAAGIHRQTIHRLLRKHGIKLGDYR